MNAAMNYHVGGLHLTALRWLTAILNVPLAAYFLLPDRVFVAGFENIRPRLQHGDSVDLTVNYGSDHFNITPEQLIRSPWFWCQLPLFLVLWPFYEMALAVSRAWGAFAVYTTTGKGWAIDKFHDVAPISNAKQEYQGWGTGATAENVSNTTLATEASEARALGALSQPAADTDRLVATQTADGPKTITEIARFNTSTKGGGGEVMQQRALFTGLPLLINDRVEGTQDLQQT